MEGREGESIFELSVVRWRPVPGPKRGGLRGLKALNESTCIVEVWRKPYAKLKRDPFLPGPVARFRTTVTLGATSPTRQLNGSWLAAEEQ